jgi:creatinine amidohydrolase
MSAVVTPVHWAELRPDDFIQRREQCPVVYLPLGLCEPHGHVAALGLDLLKAEYYCREAARSFGGIVAPSQGYHIHESGFHAPWLAEVVGEQNPLMAALPPHVMLHLFLYQLRAFANAGFKAVIAVSGHSGGSQNDLRRAAALFTARTKLPVVVKSDPEWVAGHYVGDHAGRYELSQLLAIRPDLVDLGLLDRRFAAGSGGRLALGEDAAEARAELGVAINAAIVSAIVNEARQLVQNGAHFALREPLGYASVESMWQELQRSADQWESLRPHAGQPAVPTDSRWHAYVKPAALL